MSVKELESKITELKRDLENVKGTETEVYSRIVGYYRAVNNWNKGKKDEYGIRKSYSKLEKCCCENTITISNFDKVAELLEKSV